MKISKFFKLLPDFVKNIDVNGIIIKTHEDEYLETVYRVTGERFEVPIFTIDNSQDLPYTKEALLEFLLNEITKFSQFVSADFIGVKNLIQFDDSVLEAYVPKKVEKEISECLKSVNFNKVVYTSKANYRIEGEFTGYNWIEMDGEGVVWWVDFKPFKIDVVDEDGYKVIKSIPNNEMEDIINYIKWDYSERFEDPIWRCSRNNLSSLQSFYDPNWMVWSTYVNVV
jgi:hypothetical protein